MTPGPRCLNRLFEWVMGSSMAAIGIHIIILPDAVLTSRMSPVLELIRPPWLLGMVFLVPALVRLGGLYFADAVGDWSPRMRAVGASVGGLIFLQLAVALAIFSIENHIHTSPMVCLYVAISAGEFISTYRARADGKRTS